MGITCCFMCPKRTASCHSTCEEYLKEFERVKIEREKREKARLAEYESPRQAKNIEIKKKLSGFQKGYKGL